MSEKSIVQEARDIQLAMELITLGARLQMLESETQLSRKPTAERHAAILNRLVYDLGTKRSCFDVL